MLSLLYVSRKGREIHFELTFTLNFQEKLYGKSITIAHRETVESDDNEILEEAVNKNVALLVVGDPFGATTHSDLFLRASELSIDVKVIHNASILNAVGCCGLQLYSFGETVSIPFWSEEWQPDSFMDKIIYNRMNKMHTLCLLDIKVREKSVENIIKQRDVYEKPRYMSVAVAAQQLLKIIEKRKDSATATHDELNEETMVVGLARIGSETQKIVYTSLSKMANVDIGPPLHSLIIPGTLHEIEGKMLQLFSVNI